MFPQIIKLPFLDLDVYLEKITSEHSIYLDGENLSTTEQLIRNIYSQIPNKFQYWINWSALWDVLTDLEWGLTMVIKNSHSLLSEELWDEDWKFKSMLVDLVLYEHGQNFIFILK